MLIVIIVAAILVVDQITKALAVKLLTQLPAYTYPLWQDVFHLTYTENRGGCLRHAPRRPVVFYRGHGGGLRGRDLVPL